MEAIFCREVGVFLCGDVLLEWSGKLLAGCLRDRPSTRREHAGRNRRQRLHLRTARQGAVQDQRDIGLLILGTESSPLDGRLDPEVVDCDPLRIKASLALTSTRRSKEPNRTPAV